MDAKFQPAIAAIESGDLDKFKALIAEDPSLATSRSSISHPTLLQCLVLQRNDLPNNVAMAEVLIDAGAELNEPLVAAGSANNRAIAELLLDRGAAINGTGSWSPLEEALYWNSQDVIALLLERGAKVQNLRIAAGLGRTDLIEGYFNADGSLKPEAGKIDWPFGDVETIARSNHNAAGKRQLTDRVSRGRRIDRASLTMLLSTLVCTATLMPRNSCCRKALRLMLFLEDLITRERVCITQRSMDIVRWSSFCCRMAQIVT
jgi:hypothetical protein